MTLMKKYTLDGTLSLRPLELYAADQAQMLRWMTDPETMRYWEGVTVHFDAARVKRDFFDPDPDGTLPYFMMLDDRAVGYCQLCPIRDAAHYEVPEAAFARMVQPGERAWGIDLFIGETDCRDRGLGTSFMALICDVLFRDFAADVLLIDPKAHNARAIRCYEKSGFQRCCTVPKREMLDGVPHDSLILYRRK